MAGGPAPAKGTQPSYSAISRAAIPMIPAATRELHGLPLPLRERVRLLPKDVRDQAVLFACRMAMLTYRPESDGLDPEEAAAIAAGHVIDDVIAARRMDVDTLTVKELVHEVVAAHTDAEGLAVERIDAAIVGKTGIARIVAAYRANAGVLWAADVEEIAG